MVRNIRHVHVVGFLSICDAGRPVRLAPVDALAGADAAAPARQGRYKLKIDSSPQQATVYWDAGASRNPKAVRDRRLHADHDQGPEGAVKIVVELSGFKPQEQTLDVRKSQTLTLTLERAPRMARLDLQSSADGAGGEVFIDGAPRGTIPNSFELPAGRHQVEVRKAGYKPFSDWFDLPEGERRTRDVSLERAEAPTGTLLVTSDAGGDVYVDGQRKDAAPAIITGVPAGDHVVEVQQGGACPLAADGDGPGRAAGQGGGHLRRRGATPSLRVISNEPDVEVFVDGEAKGKAPVTLQAIKPGEHIVGGRKTRFKPWSRRCGWRRARTRSSASGWRWRRPTARARR